MRIVMKMMIESDDGRLLTENEIFRIERGAQSRIAQTGLGLTLPEAKAALAATQQAFVATQAQQIVTRASHCPDCGAALKVKDCRQIVYRTLPKQKYKQKTSYPCKFKNLRILVCFQIYFDCRSGWVRIVNIASIAGKEGNPKLSAYSASKAAVIGMTKSLGKELATTGLLANVVAPSVIATPPMVDATPRSRG